MATKQITLSALSGWPPWTALYIGIIIVASRSVFYVIDFRFSTSRKRADFIVQIWIVRFYKKFKADLAKAWKI